MGGGFLNEQSRYFASDQMDKEFRGMQYMDLGDIIFPLGARGQVYAVCFDPLSRQHHCRWKYFSPMVGTVVSTRNRQQEMHLLRTLLC